MISSRKRPRFRSARRRRRIRVLHVIAGLALLAACTPRTEDWSPAESPKHNTVNWVEYHHSVAFAPSSAKMTAAERVALDSFLGRVAIGEGVRIALAGRAAGDEALAVRRETAIAAYLREHGFRSRLGAVPAAARNGTVTVSVGRYIVTPPNCPDWSKPAGLDSANRASSNFGCATEANLGLMVADPGALVRGYSIGPSDGYTRAVDVQHYRKDEWRNGKLEEPWIETPAR